jgi:hypothetical protein
VRAEDRNCGDVGRLGDDDLVPGLKKHTTDEIYAVLGAIDDHNLLARAGDAVGGDVRDDLVAQIIEAEHAGILQRLGAKALCSLDRLARDVGHGWAERESAAHVKRATGRRLVAAGGNRTIGEAIVSHPGTSQPPLAHQHDCIRPHLRDHVDKRREGELEHALKETAISGSLAVRRTSAMRHLYIGPAEVEGEYFLAKIAGLDPGGVSQGRGFEQLPSIPSSGILA